MGKFKFLFFLIIPILSFACNKDNEDRNPEPEFILPEIEDVLSVIPDEVFKRYCAENFDIDQDGKLSMDEAKIVQQIEIINMGILSLEGIEYFSGLRRLDCSNFLEDRHGNPMENYNAIKFIDLSGNSSLVHLDCSFGQIETLNLSRNTELQELNCFVNPLRILDVTKNTKLMTLIATDGYLSALDVSNNPLLETLYCSQNNLSSIDVSNNSKLRALSTGNNPIKSLNVSKNPELVILSCDCNKLTSLDLSENLLLEYLTCFSNSLEVLNLSNQSKLTELYCADNPLHTLDISSSKSLNDLKCDKAPALDFILVWDGFDLSNPSNSIPKYLSKDDHTNFKIKN